MGRRRLAAALEAWRGRGDDANEVRIVWEPFLLDGTLPKAKDKMAHYQRKFGAARVAKMIPRMKEVGETVGIAFSYGGEIGATQDSHRVAEWAAATGGDEFADKVMEEMMVRYFEREQNLAQHDVLLDAVDSAGGDVDAARTMLESEEYKDVVEDKIEEAFNMGVSGVPFFIIGPEDGSSKPFGVSGAQEPETLVSILDKVASQMNAEPSSASAL